jgi:hypothetical protein
VTDNSFAGAERSLTLTDGRDRPELGRGKPHHRTRLQRLAGDITFGETYISTVVLGPG